MAATALTGLPLIIGAFSGMGSTVLAQKVGKRGIYLTSSVLLLAGAIWNMHVEQSYAQFMVSRIFQGVAWGAFESLVLTSFNDMFFVCFPLHLSHVSLLTDKRSINDPVMLYCTTFRTSSSRGEPQFSVAISRKPTKASATKLWP